MSDTLVSRYDLLVASGVAPSVSPKLYLYLISQSENNGYDTYDSAVVCAESEDIARRMDPSKWNDGNPCDFSNAWDWCKSPEAVAVEFIGEAAPGIPRGVVCSSFNAG